MTAAAAYDKREAQQPGFTSARIESETYELGFDAAWELDLFGRVRRGVEAAQAEADAAQANLHAVQVSVAAEVAHRTGVFLSLATQAGRMHDRKVLTRRRIAGGVPLDVQGARPVAAFTAYCCMIN